MTGGGVGAGGLRRALAETADRRDVMHSLPGRRRVAVL